MPKPSVRRSYIDADKSLIRLQDYRSSLSELLPHYQHMVAELILLRSFSVVELTLRDVAFKLAVGSPYCDGTPSTPLKICTSLFNAQEEMRNHNRTKPITNLKWTRGKYIKNSVKFILPDQSPYVTSIEKYSTNIKEMAEVRNFIAHRTASSRENFRKIIRNIYGYQKKVSVGVFLTSQSQTIIPNLERYLIESRLILKEICKA